MTMQPDDRPGDSGSSPDTRGYDATWPRKLTAPKPLTHIEPDPVVASNEAENALELTKPRVVPVPLKDATDPAVPSLGRMGAFDLLQIIGRGASGLVYLARQDGLDRLVAIKVIQTGRHSIPEEIERFETEARLQGNLRVPGFLKVFAVGKETTGPWFAMEYCPGGTLGQWANHRALPPRQAAEIVLALARTMGAAHYDGVVHRDLKPGNVLLIRKLEDGESPVADELKIADLGLAKVLGKDSVALSLSANMVGTPLYMAPEQAVSGQSVGPAADVHALGVILYELITGRVPFQGATVPEVIRQVVENEPISPRSLISTCPKDLEQICLKCLSKSAARRYAHSTALAEDLEAFLDNRPVKAREAGVIEKAVKWIRRKPTQSAALVLAALLVISVVAGSLLLARFTVLAERKNEETRLRGLLEALMTANADSVAPLLAPLNAGGNKSRELAHELLQSDGLEDRQRKVLSLFLYPEGATPETIVDLSLAADPTLLSLLAEAFVRTPPNNKIISALWQKIKDAAGAYPINGPAALLTGIDPANSEWPHVIPTVARELMQENPANVMPLIKLLAPHKDAMITALDQIIDLPATSQADQFVAGQIFLALAGNNTDRLVELVLGSNKPKPAIVISGLRSDRKRSIEAIRRRQSKNLTIDQQAAAYAMLISLDDASGLIALSYHVDPTVRTE
ncbi:MAG: serine/threonine protein kinase, partial [Planctomycetes bacterium]|nr:serine/threonine protein kinase [Planctomycetota bacterium]